VCGGGAGEEKNDLSSFFARSNEKPGGLILQVGRRRGDRVWQKKANLVG